jgi:hypothetical protein
MNDMNIANGMLATSDTDLAAALLTKGARLYSWNRDPASRVIQWCLADVRGEWVRDFHSGVDGCKNLLANRKNLVRIASGFPQPTGFGIKHR